MRRNNLAFTFLALLLTACFSTTPARTGRNGSIAQESAQATPTAFLLATQVFPNLQPTQNPLMSSPPTMAPIETYFTKIGESSHFQYYQDHGYQPVEQKMWAEQAEKVYAYVSHRLHLDTKEKIEIVFQRPDPGNCPSRGATTENFIMIYADQQTSQKQLFGVLAHELGHAIRNSAAKDLLAKSIALEEGMATWASGAYWTDWYGFASLDAMVKDYRQKSAYLPLFQYPNLEGTQPGIPTPGTIQPNPTIQGTCLMRRDMLYTEWAAFIDFLIRQYGKGKIDALFKSGRVEVLKTETILYPPDYQGIYGLTINQLEAQWLASIR